MTCCVLGLKMKLEVGRLGENTVFSGILFSGHCDYKALRAPMIKFSCTCLSLSLTCGSHRHTGRCYSNSAHSRSYMIAQTEPCLRS